MPYKQQEFIPHSLGAGHLRSGCQCGWVLGEGSLPWLTDGYLLTVSSPYEGEGEGERKKESERRREEGEESSLVSSYKGTNTIKGTLHS